MKCEECGIRPATVRLMSITNGEKVARNLCAHCLADVKKQLPNLDLSGLDSMLANLLAATKKMGVPQQSEIDITCPRCGTTSFFCNPTCATPAAANITRGAFQ